MYDKAIADYNKAIAIDDTYIGAYANRANANIELKNYKAAKIDFEKAVELAPQSGSLRRLLGWAKLQLKDTAAACEDFRIAQKQGDRFASELMSQTCK